MSRGDVYKYIDLTTRPIVYVVHIYGTNLYAVSCNSIKLAIWLNEKIDELKDSDVDSDGDFEMFSFMRLKSMKLNEKYAFDRMWIYKTMLKTRGVPSLLSIVSKQFHVRHPDIANPRSLHLYVLSKTNIQITNYNIENITPIRHLLI